MNELFSFTLTITKTSKTKIKKQSEVKNIITNWIPDETIDNREITYLDSTNKMYITRYKYKLNQYFTNESEIEIAINEILQHLLDKSRLLIKMKSLKYNCKLWIYYRINKNEQSNSILFQNSSLEQLSHCGLEAEIVLK